VGLLEAAATRGVTLTGPVKDGGSWQQRRGDGFAREDFHIDFDKRQVTCPRGKTTGNWLELPSQAPYTLVRDFLPRHLHERQQTNRAQQQDPQWLRTYGSRAGVEGTMSEIVNGHSGRNCRYRGHAKTHVQHVLTAIAINLERLDAHESPEHRPASSPRCRATSSNADTRYPGGGAARSDQRHQAPRQSPSLLDAGQSWNREAARRRRSTSTVNTSGRL